MASKTFKKGEIIICEGEFSDCAFLLESGSAEVYKRNEYGDNTLLTVLRGKALFGEMGIIDGLPRSATVIAGENCRVTVLTSENYQQLLMEDPASLMQMLKVCIERLRATLKIVEKSQVPC